MSDFVQLEIPDAQAWLQKVPQADAETWRTAYFDKNQIDLASPQPHHAVVPQSDLRRPRNFHNLVVTTSEVPGRVTTEAISIVTASVVLGAHLGKDLEAGVANLLGGRVDGYERTADQAGEEAIRRIGSYSVELGADAVVGVRLDYQALGVKNGMLMATATGTAVRLAPLA
ncbi:MAG: YbjQ family protein [Alphaproteobacteria bacterium]|nr:YbjQ family protein [Alphaproteobacteria bacterium]MBU1513259.1 YbjQ family protein [Alphaproteobacteria bacterium]MBU2095367.1 YbjQ family protein [Alphaproteobacteria bacterium]MBU2152282.1 YbjQ family protein [Alphaproteobacteria bacterium]MBU2306671.1 YbjQ family protein [Alphaproteobacteria bacterium]